jgi:hypothetical protein
MDREDIHLLSTRLRRVVHHRRHGPPGGEPAGDRTSGTRCHPRP